jgi:hypothetical protein
MYVCVYGTNYSTYMYTISYLQYWYQVPVAYWYLVPGTGAVPGVGLTD